MARSHLTADELLAPGFLTDFVVGAFLGFERTAVEKAESNSRAKSFFEEVGLIPTSDSIVLCEVLLRNGEMCGRVMHAVRVTGRKLSFRWKCTGDGFHTDSWLSPTYGTILSHTRLDLSQAFKLLYLWSTGRGVMESAEQVHGNNKTAIQWFTWFREAITTVAWHDFDKIGGADDIVEIDETLMTKRKYGVGRVPKQIWVFGGISRKTGKRFAMQVVDRTAITLDAEILDNIAPGTLICSDGWSAYAGIPKLPDGTSPRYYRGHGVVIHDRNFVEPPRDEEPMWMSRLDPSCADKKFVGPYPYPAHPSYGPYLPVRYHTQKGERSWKALKNAVASVQTDEGINLYIGEWMYRNNILKEVGDDSGTRMRRILSDIGRVYPGPNIAPICANRPGFRNYMNVGAVRICECDECCN